MIKAPPSRKLDNVFQKTVSLVKITKTELVDDAYGQKDEVDSGTFTIKAEIQELTSEELVDLIPGVASVGDAWGYFKASYKVKGKTVALAVDDEITWNSKTWYIVRFEDAYLGETLWYRRAFMKRVVD